MVAIQHELLEVGVDYLTVTAFDAHRAGLLENRGIRLVRSEAKRGNKERPWGMAGYNGVCAGSAQVGCSNQGCIVRLSSDLADRHWQECFEVADNCSRIDEQATIRASNGARRLILNEYRRARNRNRSSAAAAEVDFWQSTDGGATIYLGKRSSNRFGRIYDKGAESKLDHYRNAVRYEVELKGDCARSEANRLQSAGDFRSSIPAMLLGFFRDARGVNGLTSALNGYSTSIDALVPWPTVSDDSQSLLWLEASIRSTVQRLVTAGKSAQVLKALGLAIAPDGGLVISNKTGAGPTGP